MAFVKAWDGSGEKVNINLFKQKMACTKIKPALLGGLHEKTGGDRVRNTHVYIRGGRVQSLYSKCHLFNVDIPEKGVKLRESDYVEPGHAILAPVEAAGGLRIGLGICYDLRFPEMSLALVRKGANVITYPSAFTGMCLTLLSSFDKNLQF